jgi:alpha-glucosidase (family GH31 glycosyl hydrolase)
MTRIRSSLGPKMLFLVVLIFIGLSFTKSQGITLEANNISEKVFNFILRENGVDRFEMPQEEPFPFHKKSIHKFDGEDLEYTYEFKQNPYSISVSRKSTGEKIFSSEGFKIVFVENYAEITTSLPSEYIFGLGERTTSFKLKPGTYTIYNRDAYGEVDDGKGGKNRYGSHPMYLNREKSGNFHIVYLRNSLPMDVIITKNGENYSLTYKIVGGVLDFSIFLGDKNPENSIRLYHDFLGKHTLPPFWSLGFHQSRWGYRNLTMLADVLENYKNHSLPLDTIWMDIDYMQDYVPFTVDESRYNLAQFKQYLKDFRKKFVMIAEPAMSIKWPDYEYLVKGKELDLFIKNKEGKYLINNVWPGQCYFIDYFHPNVTNYWYEALDKLHEKIDFSGVWLDMNEVAVFEAGQTDENGNKIPCNDETVFPYLPGKKPLETNTICPNSKQYPGNFHYQVHNYNPVAQQMHTHHFLEKKFPDSFPFILSRANSAGTGKYSFHWTGDNVANFDFYKGSVSEIMNNNLFGIPMVGSDICGFGDNASEIPCAKFYQMGSLFPFSRSHAHNDSNRKEPWMMGEILLKTTKKSLTFRYQILKYYYSLFISNGGSGTIFRPLFLNFYNDDMEVLKDNVLDNQFMLGEELLVVPNMNNDSTSFTVNAYFPQGNWYDLRYNTIVPSTGGYLVINTPLNEMPPVYLRGGKTIFTNDVEYVDNTYDLDTNYNFLIAFDKTQGETLVSQGKIPALLDFHSRAKVTSCIQKDCFVKINSMYKNKQLNVRFDKPSSYVADYTYMTVASLKIYGVDIRALKVDKTNLDDYIEDRKTQLREPEFLHYMEDQIIGHDPKKSFSSEIINQSQDEAKKYSIEYVNESYFVIHINGVLKIKRDNLVDIFIQFK